jgi:hypothetical protein
MFNFMEHLTDALTKSNIFSNTTDVLTSISPFIAVLLGILLAFFVIDFLIDIMKHAPDDAGVRHYDNFDVSSSGSRDELPEYRGKYKGINPDDE